MLVNNVMSCVAGETGTDFDAWNQVVCVSHLCPEDIIQTTEPYAAKLGMMVKATVRDGILREYYLLNESHGGVLQHQVTNLVIIVNIFLCGLVLCGYFPGPVLLRVVGY